MIIAVQIRSQGMKISADGDAALLGQKPRLSYGANDDFSYIVAENPVQVRDLHATVMRLFGLDHDRLSTIRLFTITNPQILPRSL